jgi:hypothetical protein
MNEEIDDKVKIRLIDLYQKAYNFLTMFVRKNATNQELLYNYHKIFAKYMRFDLG